MNRLVLLVEDNADVRELTALYLRDAGHRVLEASNGREALDIVGELAARREVPSVVVLDLAMPVMDGMTFLAHFRPAHPTVPVIVVTASGATMIEGAQHVLAKPLEPAQLRSLVKACAA